MSSALNNRCRLCANISRKLQLVNLELGNQINLLFQVEINEYDDDKLPKQICRRCTDTVNNAWIFFTKVHEAQEKLEDSIKYDIKLEEYSNASTKDEKVSTFSECREILEFLNNTILPEDELKRETTKYSIKSEKDEDMLILDRYTEDEQFDPSETWPDYPWICSICGEKCGDARGYSEHPCFEFHKRFFCMDCPKAYSRADLLLSHVSEQHWDRLQNHLLLQCDVCQVWFRCRNKQEEHRRDEHPDAQPRKEPAKKVQLINQFYCPLCGKQFTSRSNLNSHQKIHTGLSKNYTCHDCGKSYSRKAVFLNHQRIHYNPGQYTCEQCGKSFNQRCNLEEHMSLHSDARPFPCTLCARTFKTQRCQRNHMALHTAAKPHVCDVCGREFKMHNSLRDHLKNHEESKAHECEYCGKAFGLKKVLQVHRRIHTGEQPYRCAICDKRFAIWGHWRQHVQKVHAEIDDK